MMSIAEFCETELAVVERSSSLADAARKMRELHLGDVVVCDIIGEQAKPVGLLTDRDIVVGVVALDLNIDSLTVEDVMTPTLVTLREDASVHEAVHLMESYGLRRVAVVDTDGALIGLVSSSALLEYIGQELACLSKLPGRLRKREQELRA